METAFNIGWILLIVMLVLLGIAFLIAVFVIGLMVIFGAVDQTRGDDDIIDAKDYPNEWQQPY